MIYVVLIIAFIAVIFLKLLAILGLHWVFVFQLILVAGSVIFSIIYIINFSKKNAMSNRSRLSVLMILIFMFAVSLVPTSGKIKFYLLQNVYEKAAHEMSSNLRAYPDDYFVDVSLPTTYFILSLSDTKVTYCKSGDNVVLAFTEHESFFPRWDYVWLSSPEAENIIEYPAVYFPELSAGPGYDNKQPLGKQGWLYIKWY